MKTLFFFLLTCFISTAAMLAALTLKNPLVGFVIAGVVWVLFAKYIGRKKRRYR